MTIYHHNLLIAKHTGIVGLLFFCIQSAAQVCPPNIDFERGDFSSWTIYTGTVSSTTGQNQISLDTTTAAVAAQHETFSAAKHRAIKDYYGGFPVVCPNGSGYSVKLGNNSGGSQAEGLSYDFTIPANRDSFSLTYHYAVVFEDPNHIQIAQPRLEIAVTNLTDNQVIDCASFTYFPNGSSLPGFFRSPQSGITSVWCKNWSAVTINLNGKAGKTIRLFFKTADCAFLNHFGYAYIDINSSCDGELTGAAYCKGDTTVNLVAPYGFKSYKWFDRSFSRVLGNQQTLIIQPPPAPGSLLIVEVIPYDGYGCKDTIYTLLTDTLTVNADAGPDAIYCPPEPVLIGQNTRPGIRYQWTPVSRLSDSAISNPLAGPLFTTAYHLTATSIGGGCSHSDTAIVIPAIPDPAFQLNGNTQICSNSPDSVVLLLSTTDTVQWHRDSVPLQGIQSPRYRVTRSGTYYATVTNQHGCRLTTIPVTIRIDTPVPGITYPEKRTFINTALPLQARSLGVSVLWSPPDLLDTAVSFTPNFLSRYEVNQRYLVTMTSTGGCQTTDTQFVHVFKEIKVFVPTAFTPNSDNLNDKLTPLTFGITAIITFKVVNRWGEEIYSGSGNNSGGWDGSFKGIQQPTATYHWYFKGLGIDNKIYTRKGAVTLIR